MNWKRVGIGAGLAGVVLMVCDIFGMQIAEAGGLWPIAASAAPVKAIPLVALAEGAVLSIAYAVARRALVPGARTALHVAALFWFFLNIQQYALYRHAMVEFDAPLVGLYAVATLFRLSVASLVAGWSYRDPVLPADSSEA